jgi:hypothetical protein
MQNLRRIAILPMAALLLAACQSGGAGSPSEAASAMASSAASGDTAGPVCDSGEPTRRSHS